ncbi:MAG: hypothetical protein RCG15_02640 [Candidatus Rickettsia vulgarisii]
MIAIHQYSKADYNDINWLLRNPNYDYLDVKNIPLSCLHAAIASHGLNKLPEIELPTVVRYKRGDKLDQHLEDIKNNPRKSFY